MAGAAADVWIDWFHLIVRGAFVGLEGGRWEVLWGFDDVVGSDLGVYALHHETVWAGRWCCGAKKQRHNGTVKQ
jgi:hypothetical protein